MSAIAAPVTVQSAPLCPWKSARYRLGVGSRAPRNTALTANRIVSIEAILNGTSNFILTRMLDRRETYDAVLAEAQARGYAEADPAMDVDGTDAAQKLSILTQLP